MKRIAIFASGNGTNAENIIQYFRKAECGIEVALIVCNKRNAGVYERAKRLEIPIIYLSKDEINSKDVIVPVLKESKIDFIVLAGFLLMIPSFLLSSFPQKIINIHPSLLPKFGGKGMYGHFVHEAVVAAGEKETGITIHYVNEKCDEGEIISQISIPISKYDSPSDVECKIHELEQQHFPRIIKDVISRTYS